MIVKEYKCRLCRQVFSRPSEIREHMRSHWPPARHLIDPKSGNCSADGYFLCCFQGFLIDCCFLKFVVRSGTVFCEFTTTLNIFILSRVLLLRFSFSLKIWIRMKFWVCFTVDVNLRYIFFDVFRNLTEKYREKVKAASNQSRLFQQFREYLIRDNATFYFIFHKCKPHFLFALFIILVEKNRVLPRHFQVRIINILNQSSLKVLPQIFSILDTRIFFCSKWSNFFCNLEVFNSSFKSLLFWFQFKNIYEVLRFDSSF